MSFTVKPDSSLETVPLLSASNEPTYRFADSARYKLSPRQSSSTCRHTARTFANSASWYENSLRILVLVSGRRLDPACQDSHPHAGRSRSPQGAKIVKKSQSSFLLSLVLSPLLVVLCISASLRETAFTHAMSLSSVHCYSLGLCEMHNSGLCRDGSDVRGKRAGPISV